MALGVAAGPDHRYAGQELDLTVDLAPAPPLPHAPQLRLVVARDDAAVVVERDLPLRALRNDLRAGERLRTVRAEQPAGVVEVEMAQDNDVDSVRVESRPLHRRHDRAAFVAAHLTHLVGDALPDPGLDQDAPRRGLDQ